MNIILVSLAFIGASISPENQSWSIFLSLKIRSNILNTIILNFLTFSMLLIIFPLSLINLILTDVYSLSMHLILTPVANIHISISIHKSTMTLCHVILSISIIYYSIIPNLSSFAMSST